MSQRDELDVEGAELAAVLETWCAQNGFRVRFGAVDVTCAAAILERSPGTLRNWARAGNGPPCRRAGYLLTDLADFLLAERE
jgi:hypothetical protein